jgi:hypothetical protein
MLGLIIWGTSSREKLMGTGDFHCPQCQAQRPFNHHKIQRYFTLYFIPLFPVGTIAEYVDCIGCRGQFQMQVLQMQAPGGWGGGQGYGGR